MTRILTSRWPSKPHQWADTTISRRTTEVQDDAASVCTLAFLSASTYTNANSTVHGRGPEITLWRTWTMSYDVVTM
eukprot:6066138-Karenia_brevis.AAC.1